MTTPIGTRSCRAWLDCGNTAVQTSLLSFRGFCPDCEATALGVRTQPRITQVRGRLLPRPGRRQLRLFVPTCNCGWRGLEYLTDRDARREAVSHVCGARS